MSRKLVDAYLVKTASHEDLVNAIYAVMSNRSYVSTEILNSIIDDVTDPFKVRYNLSTRELEVLALLAQELPSKQIADKLNVSPHTIETNKRQLMRKLDVRSSIGLVKVALREGLVY
ncbi:MAG: response regulator transcription factor [Flavobacteriales bacterium]